MSETCRLRRGEGYGACDDEVVNQCALRPSGKKKGAKRLGNSETPRAPVLMDAKDRIDTAPIRPAPCRLFEA